MLFINSKDIIKKLSKPSYFPYYKNHFEDSIKYTEPKFGVIILSLQPSMYYPDSDTLLIYRLQVIDIGLKNNKRELIFHKDKKERYYRIIYQKETLSE